MRYKILRHSAKGSTWEEHKYIKRIDGTYYYPDSYEGGRHLSSNNKRLKSAKEENLEAKDFLKIKESKNNTGSKNSILKPDIEELVEEVLLGNFGNGQERRERLGEYYQKVQDRINEIFKSSSRSPISEKKISEVTEKEVEKVKETISKATTTTKGLDFEIIFSVYREPDAGLQPTAKKK